jgi:hypothetical protein
MEFWVTIAGLMRRRRVIIPAVLVAAALGAAVYVTTPVTYVSSTTMILTTTEYGGTQSQDPATPSDLINPMLYFNDSLKTTSAILIEAMHTRDVARQLGASGPTTLYVDDGRTNPNLLGLNGPFLYIVGQSTSPDEATEVVRRAQALMRLKLDEWQDDLGAPQNTFVTLVDVVPASAPELQRGRATKLALMAFLFGFGLSMGVAYLVHQVRTRRRASAAAHASQADSPPLAESPGPGPGRPGLDHGPPRTVPARPDATPPPDPARPAPGKDALAPARPSNGKDAAPKTVPQRPMPARLRRQKQVAANGVAPPSMPARSARGRKVADDFAAAPPTRSTPDAQPPAPARVLVPHLVDSGAKPPVVRVPVKRFGARKR